MIMIFLAAIETEEDKQKFIYLYDEFAKPLLKKANEYTNDYHLSETLVHEVFVKVARKIDSIKISGEYETFGYLNAMLCSEFKKHLEKVKKETVTFDYIEETYSSDEEISPEDFVFNKQMVQSVINAMDQMSAVRRYVFISRTLYDLSFFDIAKKLDIKEDNCRKIYQRTRKDLLELLEGENGQQNN